MRVGSHRARSVRYRDERRRAEHRHVIGIVSCARDAEDDEGAGGGAREALERGDAVGFAIEATGAAEIIGDECVVERWTRTTTAAATAGATAATIAAATTAVPWFAANEKARVDSRSADFGIEREIGRRRRHGGE